MDKFIFFSKFHKKLMYLYSGMNIFDSNKSSGQNNRIHQGDIFDPKCHRFKTIVFDRFIALFIFLNFEFKLKFLASVFWLCFVLVPPPEWPKLITQSAQCVFLGFGDGEKGLSVMILIQINCVCREI